MGMPQASIVRCKLSLTFLSIFSSETPGLIDAKFHVEPQWDGVTKVCSNGPGYGKNLKKSSSLEQKGR